MTLIEMLKRSVELFPDRTAVAYQDSKISYETLYEKCNAFAHSLVDMGLRKGQKVGVMLEKTPEAIIAFLGVAAAGGIVLPVDSNQTPHHIQMLFNVTSPSFLVVAEGFMSLLSVLEAPCPENQIITFGSSGKSRYRRWEDILAEKRYDTPGIAIRKDDIVYFNLTSGTTGLPKCAVTTHDNIYWNTVSAVEGLQLTPDDVHLCMFPVFTHPHELFARPLFLGGTIALPDNISPKSITKTIVDNRVTCMMAISPIYETLLRLHESTSVDLDTLRVPESGGMFTDPTLVEQFKKRFRVPIVPVWGSTETTGIALANPPDGGVKPGSMGRPCPYYSVEVVDEEGAAVPPGEMGELVIKGAAVCTEYFNNPEETGNHMKNGWFFTGDMVKTDADGYFYFAGRKTGMLKVAGLKVFPLEIETVLKRHPEIADVAVIRGQDRLHGDVPKAVIVLKDGVELSRSDIRKYCEEKISKYKIPRIIEFVTEIPKTSGGKILYRKL